jgi:lipopolysaccharide transport system ATP-binding protein
MEEVGKEGRTVIFVSHNMGVMESLCNQGIYLKSGQINFAGSMKQAISIYLSSSRNSIFYNHGTLFKIDPGKLTSQNFHVTEVTLLDENNCIKPVVKTWDYLKIRIKYFSPKKIAEGSVVLEISTFSGSKLIEYSTQPLSGLQFSFVPGESYADCIIPSLPLAAGDYKVNVGLAVPMTEWLCREENLASLEVADSDVYQSGFPPNQQRTVVAVEHHWEVVSQ